MSTYQLEQTGQQVQNILNEAPQTKLDLQSEIERATGKEGELAQAIADEKTRAEGIESGLRTDLNAEIQRATDKDVALENAIGAEETRAERIEGALRDDVDAIDAVIPNQASSSNQLADKAFVNSSIATNTADFKGTYNSLEQLETEVTDANANDYAFVIGTDQTGNTVYNRYKYVEGTGWEFEYALNNSSFTASQWAAINSAITAALVAKLTGLPTAEALTTSLNDLLTAIGAEKTRAELIEAGLRTDVNANAGAIVTEKNRAEGVEGTLTNGLTGEILNRSNADTALGLRIDGEATLRENADSALQGDIEDINDLIPTQASESNQLADKEFVNSSIATNTAEFKGTYNSLAELEAVTGANANDYGFVISTDETGNTVYNRYKYVAGSGWTFEYALNNSSFTASQWAAINSEITAALVAKLAGLPTIDGLNAMFAQITDLIPSEASSANKLIDAAQFIAALATKQAVLTFDSEPTQNSQNPVTSGGLYNMYVELVNAIVALQQGKQDALEFDDTPAPGSNNPVKSGGIFTMINNEVERAIAAEQGLQAEYDDLFALYQTLEGGDIVPVPYGSWPVSPLQQRVIYRVANAANPTGYSDYMYNGSTTILLATFTFPGIDAKPTASSNNLAYSGGIFDSILQNGPAFDLSAYNAVGGTLATYADLSAALTALNALPAAFKKGGMSVKYVHTYDNKYVQYRLMTNTFNTTVSDWQGVDDEPTAGSNNLVKSGGVKSSLVDIISNHDFVKGEEIAGYINSGNVIIEHSAFVCKKFPVIPRSVVVFYSALIGWDSSCYAVFRNANGGMVSALEIAGENAQKELSFVVPDSATSIIISMEKSLVHNFYFYSLLSSALLPGLESYDKWFRINNNLLYSKKDNYYINVYGEEASSGSHSYYTIPVLPKSKLTFYNSITASEAPVRAGAYRKDGSFAYYIDLYRYPEQDITLDIQESVYFIKVSCLKAQSNNINIRYNFDNTLEKSEMIGNNADWTTKDFFVHLFKNAIFAGDSVTQGGIVDRSNPDYAGPYTLEGIARFSYPTQLGKLIPDWNITNGGQSGKSVEEWNKQNFYNYNFANYDICVIELGWNDSESDMKDSLDTDVEPYDNYEDYADTPCGNYCQLIEKIKEQNQNIFIILVCSAGFGETSNRTACVKAIGNKYGLPVIDMDDSPYYDIFPDGGDTTHYTIYGYVKKAHYMYNTINRVIANNVDLVKHCLYPTIKS